VETAGRCPAIVSEGNRKMTGHTTHDDAPKAAAMLAEAVAAHLEVPQ